MVRSATLNKPALLEGHVCVTKKMYMYIHIFTTSLFRRRRTINHDQEHFPLFKELPNVFRRVKPTFLVKKINQITGNSNEICGTCKNFYSCSKRFLRNKNSLREPFHNFLTIAISNVKPKEERYCNQIYSSQLFFKLYNQRQKASVTHSLNLWPNFKAHNVRGNSTLSATSTS